MNTPTPDPATAWQVILTLGVLVAIGANMITMFRVNRKQQREVSFSFEPASKKEFDQFTSVTNANFVQVRDEMKADRADNQKHSSERSKTIFNELKSTRVELDSKIEDTRRELADKIDGMESRVIATLKNTNAI